MATFTGDPIPTFAAEGGANGTLYLVKPGTTWTANLANSQVAYSDKLCANALPNPVQLNQFGEPTTASGNATPMYGKGQYKMMLVAASGNIGSPLWTVDNIDLLGSSTLTTISTYTANLNTMASAVGSNSAYVVIDQPTTCSGNLTIPATTQIMVVEGGSIGLPGAGNTLTINGPFSAPPTQVFTGASGNIAFGANSTLAAPFPK